MMEENNRKGPGIFYAVVGVATLVVAIIGATFAYFSAQTQSENDIAGKTLNIAGAFELSVARVNQSGTVSSDDLVPTDISSTLTDINKALTAQCVADGYTGCHVYKITASSGETLDTASINLSITQTGANSAAKENWKYVVYKGSDTAASELVEGLNGSFDLAETDIHKGAKVNGNVPAVYYLMIYLHDVEAAQNEQGTNLATGSYSGEVTFQAASGKVRATFNG